MKKILSVVTVVVVVFALSPLMARASSMTVAAWETTGYTFGRVVDGTYSYGTPGEFSVVMRGSDGQLLNDGEWLTALCVEPGTPIRTGDTLYDDVRPESFKEGAGLKAAWLFDTYFTDTISNRELAGLQLAIWEVVQDNSYNLSAGAFQVTSGDGGAIEYADLYLGELTTDFETADVERLSQQYTIFQGEGKQDLIVKGNPVPEPGTVLLLGAGLLGIGSVVRKKRQKK